MNGRKAQTEVSDWLAAVARITAEVASPAPVDDLLGLIARTACELMGYDFCAVLLPDDAERHLVIRGSSGLSSDYIAGVNADNPIRLRRVGPMSPSSRAFLTGEPAQVVDIPNDPTFLPWSGVARAQGFASMIAVPLLMTGTAVGTLNCYSTERRDFGDDEVELLTTLASQAGIAVTTAQLRADEAAAIAKLRLLHESLEAQNEMLRHSETVHQRLTQVALRGAGIEGVVEVLSEVLNRPARVLDAQSEPLAEAAPAGRHEPSPASLDESIFRMLAEEAAGALVPSERDGLKAVAAAVTLGGDLAAVIVLPGAPDDFGPLDRQAIAHAATVSALEILRQRTAAAVERRVAGEIVAEMVGADPATRASAVERARTLGHALDLPHSVLVVRIDDGSEPTQAIFRAVDRVASANRPGALVGIISRYAVVLWPGDDIGIAFGAAQEICDAIGRIRSAPSVSVGVSEVCRSLGDYRTAYRTARGALELTALRGGANEVVSPRHLGVYGLLLQLDDPAELARFADGVLAPLRGYERDRGPELVKTLASYLRHNRDTAATAEELFLHPNTVRLRIRRAEQLLDASLSDTETLLQLSAALMADQVLLVGP